MDLRSVDLLIRRATYALQAMKRWGVTKALMLVLCTDVGAGVRSFWSN